MSWFRNLDTVARRFIVIGALACLLIVVGLTFSLCRAKDDAARARGGERIANAQAGLGVDAAATTAAQVTAEQDNAATTARNREEIFNAENANDSAGDAGDRGLRALCQRVQYRDDVRCAQLRRAHRPDAPR